MKNKMMACLILMTFLMAAGIYLYESKFQEMPASQTGGYIKWVDFQVTKEAMQQAFRYDVDTCQSEIHLNWIELLAYLGAPLRGRFFPDIWRLI